MRTVSVIMFLAPPTCLTQQRTQKARKQVRTCCESVKDMPGCEVCSEGSPEAGGLVGEGTFVGEEAGGGVPVSFITSSPPGTEGTRGRKET